MLYSRPEQRPQIHAQRAEPVSRKSSPKAVRVVRHTLADGTVNEYRYARNRVKRRAKRGESLGDLIAAWQSSPEWQLLKPNTQKATSPTPCHYSACSMSRLARLGGVN